MFNSTGTKLWDYKVKDDVYSVAISPDASFIAAGSWDDTLYVLNLDGKEFWNCSCGGNINDVSISRDSSALAAASDDGAAYLFERNSTVFAQLFRDARFLSGEGLGLPLKEDMIVIKIRVISQTLPYCLYVFSNFPAHPFHNGKEIDVLYFKINSENRCSFNFLDEFGRIKQDF